MVDIAPFRALRYLSDKKNSDLSKFIAPPYDVISPIEREDLIEKSPSNVVQLELPEGEGEQKYLNAAKILQKWKSKEILRQDRKPSFYVLETKYRIEDPFAPDQQLKRYGVLVALKLEAPGKGAIHPHEKTLPKAKEDRLKLISSVQTNISPIFGLFFDKKDEWSKWVSKIIKQDPICEGNEKRALSHRMWKVDDPDMISSFQSLLKTKDLFIADGHHRYEVSWAYKDNRMKNKPEDMHEAWQHVMTYVCPMEESGLLMLPTHRLVKSAKTFNEWRLHLETVFELQSVKKMDDVISALLKSEPSKRAMGWVTSKGKFILTLKEGIAIDRCMAHRSEALRSLDVVLLHDIGLGEAPGIEFLKEKEVEYTRNMEEIEKRTEDPSWVGFILSSPGVESLARVAEAGEVMPPKTTYFYPKVPTGFTLMSLDQQIE